MYFFGGGENPELTQHVSAPERADNSSLVVTLDSTSLVWRERDLHPSYLPFSWGRAAIYFSDPVFPGLLAADAGAIIRWRD